MGEIKKYFEQRSQRILPEDFTYADDNTPNRKLDAGKAKSDIQTEVKVYFWSVLKHRS